MVIDSHVRDGYASELPWPLLPALAVLAFAMYGLHAGLVWWSTPSARTPVAAVSAPSIVAAQPVLARPLPPPLPPMPPHATRDELKALLNWIRAGNDLHIEHVRTLEQKGVYLRWQFYNDGRKELVIKTAPGYLPR